MAYKRSTYERFLATMIAVVKSPSVNRYRIGYSKNSITQRGGAYRVTGWPHIVAIADRMSREEALDLEGFLHAAMQSNKRSVLYRKYDPSVRNDNYRRSAGGVREESGVEEVHGVYIAWAELPREG